MPTYAQVIELAAEALSVAGVLCILVGAVAAVPLARAVSRRNPVSFYVAYRRYFGKAILLGLELLVGGDIIRTVTGVGTLDSLIVLSIVVAVRTFLSVTLAMELEGRWPWQREPSEERHT